MGKISTWLLMLILWDVLNETGTQIPPQGFRYASYEVTIPRKLTPRYGQQEPQHVSYLVHLEGKGHMVHLRQKKGFIPKHFPVFTYSKKGELHTDYPFIPDDCFYRGFVEGTPSSLVTLSTCSGGLRGLFQLENGSYEIEPVRASTTFQHVVYRLEEEKGAGRMRCGLTEEEQSRQGAMIQNKESVVGKSVSEGEWWSHTRYAKVAIVVDFELYVKFNKNETLVILHVLDVIHTSNSFYEPLSVLVSIAGLEIWSEKNLINLTDSIKSALENFRVWRRDTLVKRLVHDAGHLFVNKSLTGAVGLTYLGFLCDNHYSAAVETYATSSLFVFSGTFSHELGHNLGMPHDADYCHCGKKFCLMFPTEVYTDKFSNCSYSYYFRRRNHRCLLIPPDPDKMYNFKYCGNKVVETGEQCDCGSKAECASDPCCQSNCTLRSGAACAFGLCCTNCQYLPARSICRQNTSICDLPEYCNGTSERCPEDVYMQDGAPCSDGAYCYHGHCSTHSGQCKAIFGKHATVTSESCFRAMNAQGDRFGNCGLKHGAYRKCDPKSYLCGRIQCDNIDDLPSLEEHITIIHSSFGSDECWGTDFHSGMKTTDIGAVRDGTPCGTDMMCMDGQCRNVSLLKYDCNITMCHNRGTCNNLKHCHCDYGWAPPDCLNKGYGGSLDSGPAPENRRGAFIRTTVGVVFLLSAATVGLGLGLYYRTVLKQKFRRMSSIISPGQSTEGGNSQ
ncbi:disintegrin and metalloproteinase domain-containing protein 21-like [Elgaria multicarinata webbii]|uniref:disintegrin and metalloproteinase domain-containing protein 21-like n=1 Tax=Elgaria multicarinata webbii TaxID=159646 RepID=UPI002FCCC762